LGSAFDTYKQLHTTLSSLLI